ncbi:hypothetical protein H1R16_10440 [Marnyiella aurantia]|uniref:Uncharacterized protein n=1 Tax=Marnyiella aurantia TaxID=2758037 RepID=A0A7D7R5B1_9FLAO|nr:hypothetical protein [Marnyiella aurantia]MBA5246526.1 hypothetical protein [Marnyiella aurantia]QMS98109.1 hypothetical protein H1R16_10440 [Marnyiella aurantia]
MVNRDLGFKILGAIVFCLIVIAYFFYKENRKTEPERIKQKNLYVAFSGNIDSIYRDYSNHGVTILILKNKKKLNFNMYEYSRFQKNDSVVKRKGEDSMYIYRDGEVKSYKY